VSDRLSELAPFAVSLALGTLVGIERQRAVADPRLLPGGIRTFPLVALLGCSTSWLGAQLGSVGFAIGAGVFGLLVIASYVLAGIHRGEHGMTTALASLLTFLFGVMAHHDQPVLAAALAVTTTAILSLRQPLHEIARRIEQDDLYAALKLAALTVVVLPVLPDESFGPPGYEVWNPFKIWLLVVLIAAIGFAGYIGTKLFDARRGVVAAGALGGLVSSTAVTLSFSGKSRDNPELSRPFALGIAFAWAAMFGRIVVEVAAVDRTLVPAVAAPLLAAMAAGAGGAFVLYLRSRAEPPPTIAYKNPFAILPAVRFGAIFAAILLVAKFAQVKFHDAGIIAAAALTGTVDVDAMTLSSAKLASHGDIDHVLAVRVICTAAASNTITKAIVAGAIGSVALRRALLPIVAATLATGGAVLFLV
jgi:uncharacterized membrane protein (DUF4010 family)